jgi:predicted amidohydrolase
VRSRATIYIMENLRAAAVQFEPAQAAKSANLETIRRFTAEAAGRGVQLLVFPECCITGYWFLRKLSRDQLESLAEPVFDGASSIALADLSARYRMTIGAGLVEAGEDGRFYNSYVVAMPDGRLERHRKLHAFENQHIASGSEFTVFDTPHGFRAGVLICYDVNLVENVRITGLMGAEVLLAPHQTGGCRTRNPHLMGLVDPQAWRNRERDPETIRREILGDKGRGWLMRWLPSRAHDNGMFLVFANGVGVDDDEIRTGNSMILDPYGRILSETERPGEDMVVADLCGELLPQSTGRLWMQARRPDLYGPLTVPTGLERDSHLLKFEE